MDLGRAFGYVTEDERWFTKLLTGGLIGILGAIVLVGPIMLMGYTVETARNIMRGAPRPLPEWDNYGEKLRVGFGLFLVSLVYSIPSFIFQCIQQGLTLSSQNSDGDPSGAVVGLILCVSLLSFVVSLIIIPFNLTSQIRYIQTGEVGASLRFGEIWTTVRNNIGPILMLFLVNLLTGAVAGAGLIVFCIGIFITVPYAAMVNAHAMAQTAMKLGGGAPTGYAPPPSYTPPTYQ